MMDNEYDVIIIGGGPAGLSCAIELQQSEKTVLIIEKNKEIGPKVCGGGLTTKIESLGIPLNIADILFSSIKMNVPERVKVISIDKPFIATIDRGRLGKILLEKLSDNIKIKIGVEVNKIDENFIEVGGQRIKYKYLVGADGSNSIVRKFLGLKIKKFGLALQYIIPKKFKHFEIFFDASLFGSGFIWVFPHKEYTSIGYGHQNGKTGKAHELKRNLEKWLENKNINIDQAKFESGIINFDYQGFEFGNKFLIGDAAGFASDLTGEGIYFGMVSGQEVAKKIINRSYKCQEIPKILKIKYIHRKTLNFMLFLVLISKSLLNLCLKFSSILLNSKWITKKTLKLFS